MFCPGPSSLIRPHPSHSQAHRDFTARRLIRDAFAVRERLGDPQVVPSFRCSFLPDMPSSLTSGSSIIVTCPGSRCRRGLRRELTGWTLPTLPQSDSRGGLFRGFTGSQLLRPARLLAPLDGSDWDTSQPPGTFTSRLPTGWSPFPPLDMTTTSTGPPMSAGLAPAGMAASFAALAHQAAGEGEFTPWVDRG